MQLKHCERARIRCSGVNSGLLRQSHFQVDYGQFSDFCDLFQNEHSQDGSLAHQFLQLGTSQSNIPAASQQAPGAHTVTGHRRGTAWRVHRHTPAVAEEGAAAPCNRGASTPRWDDNSISPHWQCSLRATSPCLTHLCPLQYLSQSGAHKCL